jgi:hypothetical protein
LRNPQEENVSFMSGFSVSVDPTGAAHNPCRHDSFGETYVVADATPRS